MVSPTTSKRGLVAEATNATAASTPAGDLRTMFSSLAATEAASAIASSPLHGLADAHKVAAVGHSAGGQTAFDALKDPRVDVAVGWEPVGPTGTPARKPALIIGDRGDIALTPAILTHEFDSFPGATRFVEITGEGHDTYTDICTSIRNGSGGLVGFAVATHLISGELAQLAVNGCTKKDIAPERFWPIVQYYTVAELRFGLGIDSTPVGLAAPAAHQFPGFRGHVPPALVTRVTR